MYPLELFPKKLGNDIFAELCRSLPPPEDASQEARDARDGMAMTHLAAFRPADAEEAMLAVRIVAAEAHARDSLRLATAFAEDPRQVIRCRNQAAAMMRTADRARKELRLCQVERVRAEALAATVEAFTSKPVPEPVPAADDTAPPPAVVAEADAFALKFPRVAARLRGREDPSQILITDLRPEDVPGHAVVHAVIHANSQILRRFNRLAGINNVAA